MIKPFPSMLTLLILAISASVTTLLMFSILGISDSVATLSDDDFRVYWNIPTFMCDNRGVRINATAYGIIQNTNDDFRGDKVIIWYNPGKFPHMDNGVPIYGGIPQNGDLEDHKDSFRAQVDTMPENFNGVAILDFEHYLPSLTNAPSEYKTASHNWVASQHPDWTEQQIETESHRSFNESIKDFMQVLVEIGREMRPNANWGYYHYPYCKNYNGVVECAPRISEMNDETSWLYEASQAMYPSIYLLRSLTSEGRKNMAQGRIAESMRLNGLISVRDPIFTYCWYRYHEVEEFISIDDILNTIALSKIEGASGSVLWGASGDLDTLDKCLAFKDYLETTLGPLVQAILASSVSELRNLLTIESNLIEDLVLSLMSRRNSEYFIDNRIDTEEVLVIQVLD